jgi:mannan endo-1,4-beta-mannosidase
MNLFASALILTSILLGLNGKPLGPSKVQKDEAIPSSSFVSVSDGEFSVDGSSFRFMGTNNYYLHYKDTAMIDSVLSSAQDAGLGVIRCWGFFDGVGEGYINNKAFMQPLPNSYTSLVSGDAYTNCWTRLDYTLSEAKKKDLKLIITLSNYWNDFGGIKEYVQWSDAHAGIDTHAKNYSADLSKFYTDSYCKTLFKNYINYFLNRTNTVNGEVYKDDPTIFAFELMNEPRNPDKDVSIVTSWTDEMSTYFKSVDSNHLLALGDEGYLNGMESEAYNDESKTSYDGSQGVDWKAILSLDNIDFGTYHLYPESWGAPDVAQLWGEKWIKDHIAVAKKIGKPCLCEEFGINAQNGRNRDLIYSRWCQTIYDEGGAGGLFWMLGGIDTGSSNDNGYYPDYDGYRLLWLGESKSTPEMITLKKYATLFTYGSSFVSFPDKVYFMAPYKSSSDYDDSGAVVIDSDETPTYRVESYVRASQKVKHVYLYVSNSPYGEMSYDSTGGYYYFDIELKYFLRGVTIGLFCEAVLEDETVIDSEYGAIERLLRYQFDVSSTLDFASEGTVKVKSYGTCNASLTDVSLCSWNGGAVQVTCKSQIDQFWSELKIGLHDLGSILQDNNKMTYDVYYQKSLCQSYTGVIPAGAEATETSYGFRNYAALDPGWLKLCLNKNNIKAVDCETVTINGVDYYKQTVSIPYSANDAKNLMVIGLVFNYLGYDGICYLDNVNFYKRTDIGSSTDGYVEGDPNSVVIDSSSTSSSSSSGTSSSNSTGSSNNGSSSNVGLIVGVSVGGVVLVGLIVLLVIYLRKKAHTTK